MRFADAFCFYQPWLLAPEAYQAMLAQSLSKQHHFMVEASSRPLLTVDETGVGFISIEGPLIRKADRLSRSLFGAVDTDKIIAGVNEAARQDEVKAVFLEIDSPGGSVQGIPELAQAIAGLSKAKYVYAFSAGWLCSAAYWVASQCDAIYVTPSARVGSIGVLLPVLDASESLHRAGYRIEVFAAGKYKSAGMPGVPLTEEQRAWLQSGVEEIATDFRRAVLSRGREIPLEAMEGQTFSAPGAMQFNLCSIVSSREQALQFLRNRHLA